MKKRSKGITILGILMIIAGLMGIYRSYVNPDPTLRLPALYEGVSILFSIAYICLGVGLFMLKEWARLGVIIVQVAGLVYSVAIMPLMEPILRQAVMAGNKDLTPEVIASILSVAKAVQFFGGVIFCAIIVFFLTRPKVGEQFKVSV